LRDFEERIGLCLRNKLKLWYMRGDKFHAPYHHNRYDHIGIELNKEVDIWDSISVSFEKGIYEEESYQGYAIEKPMRIDDWFVITINGDYRVKQPLEGGDEQGFCAAFFKVIYRF